MTVLYRGVSVTLQFEQVLTGRQAGWYVNIMHICIFAYLQVQLSGTNFDSDPSFGGLKF